MANLSSRSQSVVDEFSRAPGVTADHIANLQKALQDSPELSDQFNAAVDQGILRKIVPLTNPNAGGEYHGRTQEIHFPLSKLASPVPTASKATVDAFYGEITFVFGHELQHGLNSAVTSRAYEQFRDDLIEVARSSAQTHDYTSAVKSRLVADRRNEADAEIAGWNAVVSSVKASNPNPTVADIYRKAPGRMSDFIDYDPIARTYLLKPNLTLNPDLTMNPSLNNEAMGQNYFDKLPASSRLGHHANSDYANHYGASAIADVVRFERHYNPPQRDGESPRIAINMAALRLDEKLLEENGINLGKDTQRMPYLDISITPASMRHFDHTSTTHAYVPITAGRVTPDDPAHPDHAMLQSIREGVRKIDEGIGKPYDDMSERVSRSLLAACKDSREAHPEARDHSLSGNALNRVDHVVLGSNGINMFAVEGRLDDPAHKRCHVSTQEAIQTPVEESDQKLLAANQAIAQEQQITQQQALSQQVDAPSHGALRH